MLAILESNGYEVRSATDGTATLELARSWKPHCVILDIRMPGMGGLELARELRAIYGDDVVLIAMTGIDATSPEVGKTFEVVDHYLFKPFLAGDVEKVLAPIRR